MKKMPWSLVLVFVLAWSFTQAGLVQAQTTKVLTGTFTQTSGSSLIFSTVSGATYSAEFSHAALVRKNGSPMLLNEFLIGDKIQVTGGLWPDNSISAAQIKDLSLYAHSGTFAGKISGLDPNTLSFTLQNSRPETKTIQTTSFTAFKINGSSASFNSLSLGMSVTVKGIWERPDSPITAWQVDAKARLVNLEIAGTITMIQPNAITVLSNNTIYGVSLFGAKIINKNNQPLNFSQLNLNDTVKITGQHLSGSVAVVGKVIKDETVK